MKKTIFIITMVVSLLGVFVFNGQLTAQMSGNHGGWKNMHQGERGYFWSQLTDEQKDQVRAKIQELREQGASRQEIHEAVKAMLSDFGIEIPDNPPQKPRGRRGNHPALNQLTAEQKAELQQTVQQMRDQGATPQEIREAVAALFEKWGVEMPDHPDRGFHRGAGPGMGLMLELTPEQRQQLRNTVREMRQQNASREEILAAVKNLLTGWGVEIPENFDERFMAGPRGNGGFWLKLTDDQKQELRAKIRDMLANGADFEAIHDAVMEQIQQWGYDVPPKPDNKGYRGQRLDQMLTDEQMEQLRAKIIELLDANAEPGEIFMAIGDMLHDWGIEPPHRGFRGRRPFGPQIMNQLTEEQRQAVREKVQQMRQQGATRQEIHEAVRQMLEEFGVKFPDKPGRNGKKKGHGKAGFRGGDKIKTSNYPNPFNPETQISYTLSNSGHVTLQIFNLQGQLIRTLVNENQSSGTHSVKWDGTNEAGEKVVSGVYVYKLQAGNDSVSRRIMLMR